MLVSFLFLYLFAQLSIFALHLFLIQSFILQGLIWFFTGILVISILLVLRSVYLAQSVYHIESHYLFDTNYDQSFFCNIHLIIFCSTFNFIFYFIFIEHKCSYFLAIINGMKDRRMIR